MADIWPHASERDELSRIDYFLEHLARAVERGEVPLPSYELLAPRYLSRREELVAVLTGGARPAAERPSAAGAAPGVPGTGPAATPSLAGFGPSATSLPAAGYQRATAPPVAARPSKPIAWTTVLLFLGAFLVIVASAVFALTVWNSTGVGFRFGFLGVLTAAFYGAGYVARTRLKLRAGSAALTVVGSAMLLFDCWILIDGFDLTGPLPWAAALLFCSAVYWFTEIRLGDRFYGIAGTAAQVGWWWLMSAGIGVEVPVRLAGLALIALGWQLVAERAEDSETFGSLATVLLWSAPVAVLLASIGIATDARLVGTTTWTTAGSAVIVAASAAVVMLRSRALPHAARRWIAGLCQLPLFVVVMLPGPSSWLAVTALAILAAAYALVALSVGRAPFAIAALGMELLALLAALSLLDWSDHVGTGVVAGLAVTWVAASRLAQRIAEENEHGPWSGAVEMAPVALIGGFVLLLGTSLAVPMLAGGPPLSGVPVDAPHAALSGALLAAWAAASVARRNPVTAYTAALWSFYCAAAVSAWAFPGAHSAVYAIVLVAAAAAWLPARGAMLRFYRLDDEAFGWTIRALALAAVLGGLVSETYFFDTAASWQGVFLALSGTALFAADAEWGGPAISSAVGGALAVVGGYLAGAAVGGTGGSGALGGAAVGLVLAGAAAVVRTRRPGYAGHLSLAASASAAGVCFSGSTGWGLTASFVLVSLAWACTALAWRREEFALLAGVSAYGACVAGLAAANPGSAVTVVVLGAAGLILGVPAFLGPTGPGGKWFRTGGALGLAGLVGLAGLAALAFFSSAMVGTSGLEAGLAAADRGGWLGMSGHEAAVAILILGGYVVAQAERWRIEAGTYVGWAVLLAALLFEFGVRDFTTLELYSTAIALYLVAMGELYARREPDRTVPLAIDVVAVVIGLGGPVQASLTTGGVDGMVHFAWVVGLSLVSIAAGVTMRVRTYFVGGVAAMALVVGMKSLGYLAEVWWVLLLLIGTAMLVVALTWEWQRTLIADTRRHLADTLADWR